MERIEEILPAHGLRRIRGAHDWVVGILLRRGRAIGVVDPALVVGSVPGGGDELVILAGEPGLALLGSGTDAVTQEHQIEEGAEAGPLPAAIGMLRTAGGSYSLLDPERLRRHLGAEIAADVHGEEHGEQDPAGG